LAGAFLVVASSRRVGTRVLGAPVEAPVLRWLTHCGALRAALSPAAPCGCRYGYGGWVRMEHTCAGKAKMFKDDGTPFRDVTDNCWSLERRISDCDRVGVDVHVRGRWRERRVAAAAAAR
jgi:hypothetical protein